MGQGRTSRREAVALLAGTGAAAVTVGARAASKSWTIVPFGQSPFPYDGEVPGSGGKPFLDTQRDGMPAHTSPRGGVYPEAPTYADRSVLLALTPRLDPAAAVMVLFLHGNLARLERDVVRRQRVVAQVLASGLDAALVVPQFAVDALDSSAGHFWDADGFERFLDEAADKLARVAGRAADEFRALKVVIVAYSGGYNPAAAILAKPGRAKRIAGVVLLDAIYAEEDTFADWIVQTHDSGFFVSAYSTSSAAGNDLLKSKLVQRGISTSQGLPASLAAGVTAFVAAGAVAHNDFVTHAWVPDPLKLILSRVRAG